MERKPDDALHEPLRASAAANGGTPVWSAVSTATGVDRNRLRRVWTAMQSGEVDEAPPPAVKAPVAEPGETEELAQLRQSLQVANSGIALMLKSKQVSQLAPLLRYRDEVAARIRGIRESMLNKSEPSPDELIAEVERSALAMPADLVEVMVEIFRSRSLL